MSWLVAWWLTVAPGPGESPAPAASESAEIARLPGQEIERLPDGGYRILDIAGEGAPRVGVIERHGPELWLVETGERHRLRGRLAIPRIAGPGYKVWAIGKLGADGTLTAHRLGVLAPPRQRAR